MHRIFCDSIDHNVHEVSEETPMKTIMNMYRQEMHLCHYQALEGNPGRNANHIKTVKFIFIVT